MEIKIIICIFKVFRDKEMIFIGSVHKLLMKIWKKHYWWNLAGKPLENLRKAAEFLNIPSQKSDVSYMKKKSHDFVLNINFVENIFWMNFSNIFRDFNKWDLLVGIFIEEIDFSYINIFMDFGSKILMENFAFFF
jgi:hypothetical protein